jgi:rubrerythrin
MSIQMTGGDVVDMAVQTEVEGERFYRAAAERAESPEARQLFAYLAGEEARHRQTFEALSDRIVVTEIDPTTWDEGIAYIRATVDRAFFSGTKAPIRTIALEGTVDDMLRQAIAFEQQTILFFGALRDLVQRPNRPIIDQIVAEERDHVRRLAAMLSADADAQ